MIRPYQTQLNIPLDTVQNIVTVNQILARKIRKIFGPNTAESGVKPRVKYRFGF